MRRCDNCGKILWLKSQEFRVRWKDGTPGGTYCGRCMCDMLQSAVDGLLREADWLATYISMLRCPLDKPFRDCENFNPRNRDRCRECWRKESRRLVRE